MSENESNRVGCDGLSRFQLMTFECVPRSNTLTRSDGRVWKLRPKSMDLLVFLFRNRGKVVSKDQIFETVWKDTFVGDGVLWKSISELRQAIGDNPKNPKILITIPKRGYRMEFPEHSPSVENRAVDFRWWQAAVFAAFVLLGIFGWWLLKGPEITDVSLPIGERPRILVAQIENRTGNPVLDQTLKYAFENSLLGSGMVRTVSRTQVEEVFDLMGKAADTPLDESVARELSLRDGGITAILTGSVSKLGSEYELGIQLVDPANGERIFASAARTSKVDSLLDSVQAWSMETVRRVLASKGVSFFPTADRKVRTGSLEAFQSYLRGAETFRNGSDREAEVLFKRALEFDPAFPSAHLMLGWALSRQGRDVEAIREAEEAVALQERAAPPEQEFIRGTYHHWRGEYEEAWSHLSLLLELEPDHPWAMGNLTMLAKQLGTLDRLSELIVRVAASVPNVLTVQERGAFILVEVAGRLDLAQPLVKRARAILDSSPSTWGDESGWRGAWIRSFGVWERWLDGDVKNALAEAEQIRGWLEEKRAGELSPQRHATFLALQYLMLGRVKDARQLMVSFGAAPGLYLLEMVVLSSASLDEELTLWLRQARYNTSVQLLSLLFRPSIGGDLGPDFSWIDPDQLQSQSFSLGPSVREHIHSAGVAIDQGRPAEAIEQLDLAEDLIFISGVPYALSQSLVRLKLAQLNAELDKRSAAITSLERLSSMKTQSYPAAAIVWLFGRAHLANLYRLEGRNGEADLIEDELRRLLEYADADHPLKARLSR